MILDRTRGYMDHLVKEATEIWLHPDNFNRVHRFHSKSILEPGLSAYADKAGTSERQQKDG
jgi:hypothetical protein